MPMKHRNRGQRRMKYKFRINGKPGGVVASESERLRNGIIPGTMNCTANCENPPFELRCIVRIREQRDISAQRSLWRAPENTISLSLSFSLFRRETSFVSRQRSSSCSWIVGGAAQLEVYDLENPGDRIIGNDDNSLERIREGIRSLRSVVYFLSPGYTVVHENCQTKQF